MKGKALGGYLAGVRARLKKAGYPSDTVDALMAVVAGKGGGARQAVKIPRAVVKKIGEVIGNTKRAVVVLGKHGFKVYSLDGYQRSCAAVSKNKPWLAGKGVGDVPITTNGVHV